MRTGQIDLMLRDHVFKAVRIDEARRAVQAVMSTGSVDLYGEVIEPSAFAEHLPKFMSNPVLLADHDPTQQIGHWENVKVTPDGLVGTAIFAENVAKAEEKWQLYRSGHAKAFSVGFIVLDSEHRTLKIDGESKAVRVFTKVRLLECSAVSIPANPDALVIAASIAGSLQPPTPGIAKTTNTSTTDDALEQRIERVLSRKLDQLLIEAGPGGHVAQLIDCIAATVRGDAGHGFDYFGDAPSADDDAPSSSTADDDELGDELTDALLSLADGCEKE